MLFLYKLYKTVLILQVLHSLSCKTSCCFNTILLEVLRFYCSVPKGLALTSAVFFIHQERLQSSLHLRSLRHINKTLLNHGEAEEWHVAASLCSLDTYPTTVEICIKYCICIIYCRDDKQ